jgi:hypothetical protein
MTIGIAIAVPDGIAMCADTQTTWNQEITQVKIKGHDDPVELKQPIRQPIGWSRGAKKLFSFNYGSHKGAILTAGMASIGSRTSRAVFKKLEQQCPELDSCDEVVEFLVQGLREELREFHQVDDLSQAPISIFQFVFASFEEKDITRPYLSSNVIFSGTLNIDNKPNSSGHILRWRNSVESPGRYNACWIGQTEFVTHIVNHKNPNLPPISGQFQMMTLEDAVNYTKFLAEFTCDFQRFAVMVPDCGRPVASAVLVPEEFRYVINEPEI